MGETLHLHTLARTPTLDPEDLPIAGILPDFLRLTTQLDDPRREHLRVHQLDAILFIVLAANMAGITSILGASQFASDYYEWCSKYVTLNATPPCNKTIGRVMAALNAESVEKLMRLLSARQLSSQVPEFEAERPLRHLAADGKAVSGSVTKHEAQTPRDQGGRHALMTINVVDVGTGLTLASAGTAEPRTPDEAKAASTDVPVRPPSEQALLEEVLRTLDLRGSDVSVDAGHARRAITDILDAVGSAQGRDQAYWMMCIKGNQNASRELIRQAFAAKAERRIDTDTEQVSERGDSRTTRVIEIVPQTNSDEKLRELWPRVATMIIVARTRTDRGSIARKAVAAGASPKQRTTLSYYLSSRVHTAKSAHDVIRGHWQVENGLHWMLDVNYGEDAAQLRERTAARNMAIIRRIAKNMLTAGGKCKGGVRDQRRFAASEKFRDQVFGR